jgi:hypothetical protein
VSEVIGKPLSNLSNLGFHLLIMLQPFIPPMANLDLVRQSRYYKGEVRKDSEAATATAARHGQTQP